MLGSVLCKGLSFGQDLSTAVSILSIVVMAIKRYRGNVFPLRKELISPGKLCKIAIPLIWITSMGLHAVYLYNNFRTVTYDTMTYFTLTLSSNMVARTLNLFSLNLSEFVASHQNFIFFCTSSSSTSSVT